MYNINLDDIGLTATFKREANIKLASLNCSDDERLITKSRYDDVLNVIKAIDNTKPTCDKDVSFIINTINTIWNKGLLSPLTLKDDEFSENVGNINFIYNKRCSNIRKNINDGSIYNFHAFNLYVKKLYSHTKNKEEKYNAEIIEKNHHIFIYKGGVVTGEYINDCIIRKDIIKKGFYTLQSIINIPVSCIVDDSGIIYVCDCREPKLKILREFYEVPIYEDEFIKNKKYDIRKYIKLN